MASSSMGLVGPRKMIMNNLIVPGPVRLKLGESASDGLVDMFAEAHALATESFERRLGQELATMRIEMGVNLANLRADVLKWSFLFWIGQLAAMTGILSLLLPR